MDQYTAANAMEKLLDYMRQREASGGRLYKPGIARLEGMTQNAAELYRLSVRMLLEESMNSQDEEFESQISMDIRDQIQSVIYEAKQLLDLVDTSNSDSSVQLAPVMIATPENQMPDQFGEGYIKLSRNDLKQICHNYATSLSNLAKVDCSSLVANKCAGLIWSWYNARIIKKYSNAPPFHYCITRIKGTIYAIVTLFGVYHEKGELDKFISNFESWIDKLGTSPDSNKWIGPYDVYKVERMGKVLESEYATLTATVLWDILIDNGLKELCGFDEHRQVYLRDNEICERVESANVEVLDTYINYKDDPSILTVLGLE